jgi:hypothetical protein
MAELIKRAAADARYARRERNPDAAESRCVTCGGVIGIHAPTGVSECHGCYERSKSDRGRRQAERIAKRNVTAAAPGRAEHAGASSWVKSWRADG